MTRFNSLMNSHFRGCKLLGEVEDEHRGRTMKVYFVGEADLVGISDGTDSWMAAPTSCLPKLNLVQLVTSAMQEAGLAGTTSQPAATKIRRRLDV